MKIWSIFAWILVQNIKFLWKETCSPLPMKLIFPQKKHPPCFKVNKDCHKNMSRSWYREFISLFFFFWKPNKCIFFYFWKKKRKTIYKIIDRQAGLLLSGFVMVVRKENLLKGILALCNFIFERKGNHFYSSSFLKIKFYRWRHQTIETSCGEIAYR